MSYFDKSEVDLYKNWFIIGGIALIFVCAWITMGIWRAASTPALTGTEKARQEFIDSCKGSSSVFDGNGNRVYNVPNTASPDPTKWTCQR